MKIDIKHLRSLDHKILVIGSVQPAIVQSILDFDYLSGKKNPSIVGFVVSSSGRRSERYFWGEQEIVLQRYAQFSTVPENTKRSVTLFLNMNSGRRVRSSTEEAIQVLPHVLGGVIFAENVPEIDALAIYRKAEMLGKFVLGPASVGIVIPEFLKLGPIGGLSAEQQQLTGAVNKGKVAVFSASGGMVGEIMTVLARSGHGFSFCLTFGGDRFPIVRPVDAFLSAEEDPETETIVYYGELGGKDEYEIVELIKNGLIKKKVIAYIAGSISEMFEKPVQFGHAKAMAKEQDESATAKRSALQNAGAVVAESFEEFVGYLQALPKTENKVRDIGLFTERKKKMFVSSLSEDKEEKTILLGKDLLERAQTNSLAELAGSMFLGREIRSKEFVELIDFIFKLLVDNGPYQSGVVNTMVAARAGKDMMSAVSAGLLTIGPRFGGATNAAATNWFDAVEKNMKAFDFVESFAKNGEIIPGIGHVKFRVDLPDPRVAALTKFSERLTEKRYVSFAKEVESVTTAKKGNLILNVDGMMGALVLDYLVEFEKLSVQEIQELLEIEFFNVFFVFPRTIGFIAHFLDQKRLDEGLFRLTPDDVRFVTRNPAE